MAERSGVVFDGVVLDEWLAAIGPTDVERCRSTELRLKLRVWARAIAAGREPGKKASGFPASWAGGGGHEVSSLIAASGAVGR